MMGSEEQGMPHFPLRFKNRMNIHPFYVWLAQLSKGFVEIQRSCCIPEVGKKQQEAEVRQSYQEKHQDDGVEIQG
jgi:hypothetical protein